MADAKRITAGLKKSYAFFIYKIRIIKKILLHEHVV